MASKHMREPSAPGAGRPRALIVDFGGVLTTSVWSAFAAFCDAEGLPPETIRELFRGDGRALALLRGLETGELEDSEFERSFAALLGLDEHDDLIARMFAGLAPDEPMIGAVRAARAQGIATALISNSFGLGIYERAPTELFDETVISGEVGLHKPQPEIYLLACERLGVEPTDAVFVDDLRENCEGAEAVGMTAIRHRDGAATVGRLEDLLGVELGAVDRSASR
jgi:putative hydrolase of the HAD superfamily